MSTVSCYTMEPPPPPPPPSSSSCQWRYDVFLSFRGEDTRNNFTGHLYDALCRRGINAFIDADKLRRGQVISPSLLTAIESSTFSIIVLSENYASSRWCLVELVKILDCMKTRGQRVLPIFYNVDPSDVRNQWGNFGGEALNQHGQSRNTEEVQVWRDALTQVANLSGWDSRNKHEPSLIKEIVGNVFNRLLAISPSDAGDLVGTDSHFRKMQSLLSVGTNDVRIIGIWGMGGIGKTTIARIVYDQIKGQFEACCFLTDVREESEKRGLVQLQRELLSQLLDEESISISTVDHGCSFIKSRLCIKSVLIVIDDAHSLQQLEYLAGKHDWFGPGSRIIITTRDKHLLDLIAANEVYEVEKLYDNDALKLFSRHAFKEDHPTEGYMELSNDVVSYAQGLPLALKVLGSSLFRRSKHEWRSLLDKLKMNPPVDIVNVLQVTFDGLDDTEKDIFLDVACFFKGEDKDYAIEILDGCGFCPHIGIRVLIEKALITLVDNKLWMHDLLQEMGWDIVCRTSHKSHGERLKLNPGKRTRLWLEEDVYDVLTQKTGTESIEGIFVNGNGLTKRHFTKEAFAAMKKLRLLKVYNSHNPLESRDSECECASRKKNFRKPISGDFEFPSDKLSYLYWPGCPLKSLPSNFHPKNLVELNLCCSYIEELWKGVQALEKLKFLDLTHSKFLKKIPDLSRAINLERLVLDGCTRLSAVNPNLAHLKKLIFLSLKDCLNLRELPSSLELECLEILILSGCSKLRKIPGFGGCMKCLSRLFLDGTAIQELPSSIEYAAGLVEVNLSNCKKLKKIPDGFCNLKSLETLLLSHCSKLKSFPNDFGKLKGLRMLQVDRTPLRGLPDSFSGLTGLLKVSFSGWKGSSTSVSWLLPWKKSYSVDSFLLKLSAFRSLENVNLSYCNIVDGMQLNALCLLSSLRYLNLSGNNFVLLPSSFSQLSQLESLVLKNCRRLQELPGLPSRLLGFYAKDPVPPERIPKFSKLFGICIHLTNCLKFQDDYTSIIKSILQTAAANGTGHYSGAIFPVISAIIPGSGIPEWFGHQNEGHTIVITPSPNRNPSNYVGFAFCVVLDLKDADTRFTIRELSVSCCIVFMYFSYRLFSTSPGSLFWDDGLMKSDHILLGYVPSSLPKKCQGFKISFQCNPIAIKSCGIHLMYIGDMIENISTPPPPSSVVLQELESLEGTTECSAINEGILMEMLPH